MKYNTEDALKEISRRGMLIRRKHEKRVTQFLSAATFIMAFVLIGTISVYTDTSITGMQSDYGSFLLSAEAGGYVFTAVIAFMLGVILTIAIKKYRNKRSTKKSED